MEKIIIRKKTIMPGSISGGIINLAAGKDFSQKELIDEYGYVTILKKLFGEELEQVNQLLDSQLFKHYKDLIDSNVEENDYFMKAFKIEDDFCLTLDANIYLYHLTNSKDYCDILPWVYADGKKYLGDTWWEKDDEIIENIKKMNVVDFLRNYKGY